MLYSAGTFFEEESIKNQSLRVMKTIAMLHNKHNIPYKEIAVLYRMSYLSRAVEDSLLTAGIPYKIVGGTPFYARKEVKDILSYARLLYNPFDFEAFKRAITVPKRGISDKTIDKIFQYARSHEEPMDFITAMNSMEFTGKAYEGVKEFNHILSEVVEDIDTSSASVVLNKIVSLTNYRKALEDGENQSKVEEKMANLVELIEISTCFDTIEDFLNDTSLNAEINEEETSDNDRVQLMTMHASKGLEYEAIIIIDANEGIIPHWKADTEKELEEERRLFYVAMTRAKKYLFITRTKVMLQNGKPVRAIPSRFVRDIDVKYIYDYYKKKKTRGN
jgi:DNA helicase-2/ATP-dependent DNA helicase PcrA